MEEFDEMQKSLTEPIKLDESDDDLEKELDDLLHSDSPDKSLPPVPSSEIPELEKRLSDLRLPGLYFWIKIKFSIICTKEIYTRNIGKIHTKNIRTISLMSTDVNNVDEKLFLRSILK